MIPVVFINCSLHPFLDMIMADVKLDETRTRNTLRSVTGSRVLFAETGRGRKPLVRCSAVLLDPIVVRSRETWDMLRNSHCVPAGSKYDWQPWTKVKYLYPIINVVPVVPFVPPEGVRHGRTWMEYNN